MVVIQQHVVEATTVKDIEGVDDLSSDDNDAVYTNVKSLNSALSLSAALSLNKVQSECSSPVSKQSPSSCVPLSPEVRAAALLVCAFNFFSQSIHDGMGPLQGIYLVAARGWSPGEAGIIWMVREFTSMIMFPLIGSLFDRVVYKRLLLITSMVVLNVANVLIIFTDDFGVMMVRAFVAGIALGAVRPGYNSLMLGIVGRVYFGRWSAYGESWKQFGTLTSVGLAGVITWFCFPDVQFMFVIFVVYGVAAVIVIAIIPPSLIDFDNARSATKSKRGKNVRVATNSEMCRDMNLIRWAATFALFHFGNAAQMPLLGQVVALSRDPYLSEGKKEGLIWAMSLIVTGKLVAVIVARYTHQLVKCFNWKRMLYVGFGSALVRAVSKIIILRWLDSNIVLLVMQAGIDGIGSSINGVAAGAVTAILTRGSGRFGQITGAIAMAQALGASSSNLVHGFIADVSYENAFVSCAVAEVACLALLFSIRFESAYTKRAMKSKSDEKRPEVISEDPKSDEKRPDEKRPEVPNEVDGL